MTNPYPLIRALEVILTINPNGFHSDSGSTLTYAKLLAARGLGEYNAQLISNKDKQNGEVPTRN